MRTTATGRLAAAVLLGLGLVGLGATALAEAPAATGDVRYGDTLVTIDALFKEHQKATEGLRPLELKVEAARQRVAEVQRQLNMMKNEGTAKERPIRAELNKAREIQRDCERAMEARPPVKPVLRPIPPPPQRPSSSSRSSSGVDDFSSASYDNAYRDWQRQRDLITYQNQQLTTRYNQQLQEHTAKVNAAKKQLPGAEATIKKAEEQLAVIAKEVEAARQPFLGRLKVATDEAQAADREASVFRTRLDLILAAMRDAPEGLLWKRGFVFWENALWPLEELEKHATTTQVEIERVHEQLQKEAKDAGRDFPTDWRHPQQDRMDALKVLLAKARAARDAAVAAAPAPAS